MSIANLIRMSTLVVIVAADGLNVPGVPPTHVWQPLRGYRDGWTLPETRTADWFRMRDWNLSASRNPKPLFTWKDTTTNSEWYAINIFAVDPEVDPDNALPITFDHIKAYSFVIPAEHALAPGVYWWELMGCPNEIDCYSTGYSPFAILARSDLNEDCVVDRLDYLEFVVWFAADDMRADFNSDGSIDLFDYLGFMQAFSEGH